MSSPLLNSILLIDDDEISNLFNKIFVSKLDLDVKVDVALNGAEALAFLKEKILNKAVLPCLLLLDIRMPVMNGWQFLEAYDTLLAQEMKDNIVIVMLSTSEDEADMIKAFNNPNIKDVLKKPLSESKFNTLIEKFFTEENTTNSLQ